jgi:type IV pilus assembly protein PilA
MWLNAFLYWIVLPVGLAVLSIGVALLAGEVASTAFYYAVYGLISLLLVPMFANRMYYRHALSKISKVASATSSAEQHAAEMARIGGTSKVVWVILPLMLIIVAGMIAAIAIPAYQDYTIRAQVAEGLSLSGSAKAAITEQYLDTGEVPFDNAAAGLPDPENLSGSYVASIAIEDGTIVVSYGNLAHEAIHGDMLVLEPAPGEDNTLAWECWSPDIEARHLPAACR